MLGRGSNNIAGLRAPWHPEPRSSAASVVAEDVRIDGNLFSDGEVRIEGRVDGDVSGRRVAVGVTGCVLGRIVADEALVSGTVRGGIAAHTVVLTATAKVACGIIQERLTVEAGAEVAGVLERPGTRAVEPRPLQGEQEIILIERVIWTRRNIDRWVPLGAAMDTRPAA